MEFSNQKSAHKKWCILGIIICVTALFCFGIWLYWMFGRAERIGSCSNGFTVWRRNLLLTFMSYRYEIRDGVILAEDGLTLEQLKVFQDEYGCTIVYAQGG